MTRAFPVSSVQFREWRLVPILMDVARRNHNPIVLLLVLVARNPKIEGDDENEDEKPAQENKIFRTRTVAACPDGGSARRNRFRPESGCQCFPGSRTLLSITSQRARRGGASARNNWFVTPITPE